MRKLAKSLMKCQHLSTNTKAKARDFKKKLSKLLKRCRNPSQEHSITKTNEKFKRIRKNFKISFIGCTKQKAQNSKLRRENRRIAHRSKRSSKPLKRKTNKHRF